MSWYYGRSGNGSRPDVTAPDRRNTHRLADRSGVDIGRRGSAPSYWNGGFNDDDVNHQVTTASTYGRLEPILEDMPSPSRPYLNGAASGVPGNGFDSRQTPPSAPLAGNNRRHSEGDLLEMSSAGPRFNKKPPVTSNRLLTRQSSNDARSPRRKSSAGADSPRDIDAFSESKYSMGSEDSLSSASQLSNRRKSEASSLQSLRKTSSTASLVANEQKRKASSNGTPSVVSTDRRSSVASALDGPKPAQERRLSALTLGGGASGPSPFNDIEIPMELLDVSQSRLRKLLTPIILMVIVVVIIASLSVAIYFAVVLKDAQDKQIEFLKATLQLRITKDRENRNQEKLEEASLKTDCCRQVDALYLNSILKNEFRGCEINALEMTKIDFSLYFLNKTLQEETIVGVLAERSTNDSQTVDINGFEVNIGKEKRGLSLNFVKRSENFIGVHSPDLKPITTPSFKESAALDPATTTEAPHTSIATPAPIRSEISVRETPSLTEKAYVQDVSSATTETKSTTTASIATTPASTTASSTTSAETSTTTTASTASPTTTAAATSTATWSSAEGFTATAGQTTSMITLSTQDLSKICQANPQRDIQAHPSRCTDYIQCEFDQAKTRPCPPGLIFDGTVSQCVLPDRDSPCKPRPCDNDLNGGFYVNPMNCSQYIVCAHGKAVVSSCNGSMVWDQKVVNCVTRNEAYQCLPVIDGVSVDT